VDATLEDFRALLGVAQLAAGMIVSSGQQHAPIVFGAKIAGAGKYGLMTPILCQNEKKSDLVDARNLLNVLLSKRVIDIGIFICESWVLIKGTDAERKEADENGLERNPNSISGIVMMMYSRDEEHCVINPIEEGPPRKMVRGNIKPDGAVESGRMSMYAI
jgi:hypothetical protein